VLCDQNILGGVYVYPGPGYVRVTTWRQEQDRVRVRADSQPYSPDLSVDDSLSRKAETITTPPPRAPWEFRSTQTEMFSRRLPLLSRSFHGSTNHYLPVANIRLLRRKSPNLQNPVVQSLRFRSSDRYSNPPPPPPFPQRNGTNPRYRTKFDPDAARNARPLITGEQIFSQRTGIITLVLAGGSIVFYVTHLEDVPVSGRTRFICYSDESVEEEGKLAYRHVMSDYKHAILPEYDARTQQVKRVMRRLIPASGMEGVDWEVSVIDSPGMHHS
jgi:hypothetical protein